MCDEDLHPPWKNLEIADSRPSHSDVSLSKVFEVFGVAVLASVVRAASVKQNKKPNEKVMPFERAS